MNSIRRIACILVVAFGVVLVAVAPRAALAQGISATDQQAIRAVIEGQLAAFAADDAARAFAYATPVLRERFGTPDRFVEMVRRNYPVIYRPASVIFLTPVRAQGQIVQGVNLTDTNGGLWLAVYQFERQPDASWRISACVIQPSSGRMT